MHHCSAVFCFTTMVYIHYTLGLFKGLFKRSLHVIIFFYDFLIYGYQILKHLSLQPPFQKVFVIKLLPCLEKFHIKSMLRFLQKFPMIV